MLTQINSLNVSLLSKTWFPLPLESAEEERSLSPPLSEPSSLEPSIRSEWLESLTLTSSSADPTPEFLSVRMVHPRWPSRTSPFSEPSPTQSSSTHLMLFQLRELLNWLPMSTESDISEPVDQKTKFSMETMRSSKLERAKPSRNLNLIRF